MIIASLCVMVFIPVPVAVFASLFVMGLGIANLAPILISAASRDKKMEASRPSRPSRLWVTAAFSLVPR